ncbi:DNA helicase II/ATP-dependent DNA helicase PcrA [Enterococcus sp. 7F3_DIV0205]|uniref:DNA helicase II/ATP-dependent DNA helicase PcrA n=1 Tax=Candidatus Enterococcus palustris TaxID=1834189 RepID=A0AAQ3WE74_9ENTE|nr:ATP-dependent helicase [Enterococcus sp. 7F3_DIV0205]OTN82501.1 hypothetical protein A5821_002412 [Enterococcus sp. 7F3_DIV0205]
MVRTNLYFINAPAGSGKTYFIKDKINQLLDNNFQSQILCITYTERAANELKARIISDAVDISTIHSFVNSFLSPFFSLPEVIDFFVEVYHDEILDRLVSNDGEYAMKYKEIIGLDDSRVVTIDDIKERLNRVYYNERERNSILYGGISHDSLLSFAFKLLDRYPIIKLKLKEMYQYIFIDEVQDTSSDILNFFYEAVLDSSTELYVFGDKMQEIYDNYDGSFENQFSEFDKNLSKKFITNYRSSKEILDVLENVYLSDLKIEQQSKKGKSNKKPQILVCDSINKFLENNLHKYNDFLQLRTLNRHRFENNNPKKDLSILYSKYREIYPSHLKIKVMDVLLPRDEMNNPDLLLGFIFKLYDVLEDFQCGRYGSVIQEIKKAKFSTDNSIVNIFNLEKLSIEYHKDKALYASIFQQIYSEFMSDNKDLHSLFEFLIGNRVITKSFYNEIVKKEYDDGFKYADILSISLSKFFLLAKLRYNQNISTQHGVKGEGHDKVMFISENSSNPGIHMYKFFKIFSELKSFGLDEFQKYYYDFKFDVEKIEKEANKKIRTFDVADRDMFETEFEIIYLKYKDNPYFEYINRCGVDFKGKLAMKKVKKMFNVNAVRSTLQAYKLFYVGCSRAKEELIVVVEEKEISGFKGEFIDKMMSCGFDIVNE